MKINRFRSENFRNGEECDFSPSKGVNILIGENGQGKTNILEGIYLMTGEKSFRNANTLDFIRKGEEKAFVSADFDSEERQQNIRINFMRAGQEKKEILLNDIRRDSPSALTGKLCMVVFSPENLSVIKEGPDERRKLADTSISQITPAYSALLINYSRILFQRNTLLRDMFRNPSLSAMLPVWDERLAKTGARIIRLRNHYVERILPSAQTHYEGLCGGREKLSLKYSSAISETESTEKIFEQFMIQLEKARAHDIEQGQTSVGPHRDDIDIRLDGAPARFFGSQGQQRSIVLAIKLAEAAVLRDKYGEPPILLLDDVLSELDRGRQDYIVGLIRDCQVFITCCEWHESIGGRIFRVDGGRLRRNYRRRK